MIENIKDNPLIEKRIEISNNYTSCIYCGIRTEEVLIQCGQCDHKFCNGISEDINNSHILTHFDISKHNTIKYPKKKLNEELYSDNKNMEIISCGYCNESNIYKLYFYKDEKNKKIGFLCEKHFDKKLEESKNLEKNYYKDNFKKIIYTDIDQKNDIKYYHLSPDLVEIPSKLEDLDLLNDCEIAEIKINEQVIQQMDTLTNKFLNKVKFKYESSNEYYDIYKPLIYSEWNYTKKIFEMKPSFNIDLYYSENNKNFYFYVDDSFIGLNFNIEKRLIFTEEIDCIDDLYNILNEEEKIDRMVPINFVGIITNIIHMKKEFCKKIEILPVREDMFYTIKNNLGKFYVKENFCEIPFIRMILGLEHFANINHGYNKGNNYTSNLIFSKILGIGDEKQIKELEENELKDIFNENELITKLDNYGELNTNQKKCLSKIFSNPLNMIQGPPGTGKTFLASYIIYNIFKKRNDNSDKILVCAPSNSAADNLAQYLINLRNCLSPEEKEKIKILRVYPKTKELLDNNILKEISLHNKLKIAIEEYKKRKYIEKNETNIDSYYDTINKKNLEQNDLINNTDKTNDNKSNEFIKDCQNLDNNSKNIYDGYSNEKFEEEKNREEEPIVITADLIQKFAKYIINNHDIIVSTCSTSYDEKLIDINFKYVLIDEATQCCEIESLLPLLHRSRYIVMIGDQKQLGPTIIYPKADLVGMKISLFERMIKLYPDNYFMLKKQYRMSEKLVLFPSKFFYEGKIKTSSKHENKENKYIKRILKKFPWAKEDIPILFINTNNKSTFKYNTANINNNDNHFTSESDIGKSYQNELEANITIKILDIFNSIKSLKKGKYDIGIITPYTGQKKLIFEKLIYDNENDNDTPYIDLIKNNIINIASVDSFQGKEKDFIIINTVRSNSKNMIGFLKDIRRLNVSITRARHGLIIIGDAHCLAKSIGEKDNKYSIWRYLIKFYQDLGVIVDYIEGEKDVKMFKPVKIIEEKEELKDYEFNEYDYNDKDNKPFNNYDYDDNSLFIKSKFFDKHYIDDSEFFNDYDDDFFNDNEFINEFNYKNDEDYNYRINYQNYDNIDNNNNQIFNE